MAQHQDDAPDSEGVAEVSRWRHAPGPLAAAAIQFVAAAACAVAAAGFGSAAAGAGAVFFLTDAWAHWRAADRVVLATRAPTAWAATATAVVAIAAVAGGVRAAVAPAAPAAVPVLVAASVTLVAGVAAALAVLPLRLRDASGVAGWDCGQSWPAVPIAVAIAGIAAALLGSAWPDLLAAVALVLAYGVSVARMLRGQAAR